MAILQKNIWIIFYVLLLGAILFLSAISYTKWQHLHTQYATTQNNLVKLVSNATHSLLLSQETTLNILGSRILKEQDPASLDELLALNPSIVAFGFVDLNGTYLHANSKFDKSKLPNLRAFDITKDSFDYTKTQEKMVLGRTYFIAASGQWGIPIRKTIYDANHQAKGVMTAGLSIEGAFKIFNDTLSQGASNKVTLVRDRDRFVQFQSSTQDPPKEIYSNALSEDFFQTMIATISQTYQISAQQIKEGKQIYLIQIARPPHKNIVQMAIKYDPRYELWIFSEIDHQQIVSDFLLSFTLYCVLFVVVHLVLFFLFRMIIKTEEKRRNDLVLQATHDELTQLPNRNFLHQNINQWIYEGAPPFSLYYLDMDHFKNVNDSFGHQFGDLLLIEFSKRISSMVRKDSIVIRQGGDEFIILTYRIDEEEILGHTKAILQEVSKPYRIKHFSFVVGVSIGIAQYPNHGTTLDMLLRASDIAMYEAKKHKNSVRLFNPSMQEGYLNRVTIEQALHKALENNEFFMVYQPQMNAQGEVYGVEALIRWNHEEMGFIAPDQFIPIAEASGFMPRLGGFIINTSLHEMKTLQTELGISFQTSLNISIKQFMDLYFLENLTKKMEQTHLKDLSLCLEITESLFIEDIEYVLPLLQKIHDLGFFISMDDFGTGYSSLSILRKLPIDELKIDKSFVDTILNDITAKKMIQNIISIGKNLELYILAEGVETKEQEEILKTFGCDRFQGYLYSRPLTYEALKIFFQEKEVSKSFLHVKKI